MTDKVPMARDVLAPFLTGREAWQPVGQHEGGEPADELQHFYVCQGCGQPVDMRDLAAVFRHEVPRHKPLPVEDAERLLRISEKLRAALGHSGSLR